jgi:hypothetical protein
MDKRLDADEREALVGIGDANARGIQTSTQAHISKRLIKFDYVRYDPSGHLVLTKTGEQERDCVVAARKATD